MPGEYVFSTCLCFAFLMWLSWQHLDDGPLKYTLCLCASLPLGAPATAFVIQYTAVIGRRVGARVVVRRARHESRAALRAARRHPELADLDDLREPIQSLSRLAPADALRAIEELNEVVNHPYGPIRDSARGILAALAAVRHEQRSGPPV